MKFVKQLGIILIISFLGEMLHFVIPLPVPSSIYGLMIMIFVLKTGIISLDKVKDTGNFLVEIMPLMFIPAAVGLLVSWTDLKKMLLPAVIITAVSTVVVMAVAGRITQAVIVHSKNRLYQNKPEAIRPSFKQPD